MSILTNLTRTFLTRTTKPFTFTDQNDEKIAFETLDHLGLYVHIPFCKTICSFCPYCKVKYDKEICDQYIDALLNEIQIVCRDMKRKKRVTSLYFGGGTPALAADRLGEIIRTLQRYFIITEGIGVELHPENVTPYILQTLKNAGVTKISIGIQSFQSKFQKILGRKSFDIKQMAKTLRENPFETVSMDFIFALPDQTFEDLKNDIDLAFSGGANHIAVYPFIDFTFTKSKVPAMDKKSKRKLLDEITEYCSKKGYQRDSIWTFSAEKDAKYSSMTRENFLGFGCSATTLLKDSFKINTFSIDDYCERIRENRLPTSLTIRFTERQRMVYYLFWMAYTTKVDSRDFEKFFGVSLRKSFGFELNIAQLLGFVTERNGIYTMTKKGAFYYHFYENFYTLAYIDKMWGIMRQNAFPHQIQL